MNKHPHAVARGRAWQPPQQLHRRHISHASTKQLGNGQISQRWQHQQSILYDAADHVVQSA